MDDDRSERSSNAGSEGTRFQTHSILEESINTDTWYPATAVMGTTIDFGKRWPLHTDLSGSNWRPLADVCGTNTTTGWSNETLPIQPAPIPRALERRAPLAPQSAAYCPLCVPCAACAAARRAAHVVGANVSYGTFGARPCFVRRGFLSTVWHYFRVWWS